MDHHTVAAISLTGICLDVLGGLYLAYDLLGGKHGPLRLLTRAVTYSIVFGIGYALGLGLLFGIAAGVTTGITVAIELQRTAAGQEHYPLALEAFFSAIRAAGFGLGLYPVVGSRFALTFSILVAAGQVVAYSRGLRPGIDYSASLRPRFTRRQAWGTVLRTVGYTAAALLCSVLVQQFQQDWPLAIRVGIVTGFVTTVGISVNPLIEYYADNLPERRMGVFGILLLLCGFALQSFQYLAALIDLRVS